MLQPRPPSEKERALAALRPVLRDLQLSGALATLELRAREAAEDELSHSEFLYRLLSDELEHRSSQALLSEAPLPRAPSPRPLDPSTVLAVGPAAQWFQLAEGQPVDLARRGPVRRILKALVERHASDKRPLGVSEVLERGWPGQTVPYESGAMRVYTAVRTLRRLGLEGLLITRDEGYLLAPMLRVMHVEE